MLRARADWLIPAVTVLALAGPMALGSTTFATEWPNHLWLLWHQSLSFEEVHRPSYFLHSELGAFLPWYAFSGGTLYAAGGLLGALTTPLVAYAALHAVAFAAAHLGLTWLSRQLGLRGWRSQLPGFLYVTSAAYVTTAYGRGDFPETVAVSMLPLVLAAALHLLRSDAWRPLPVAAFLGAVVLLTGSHATTLVWGTVVLAAVTGVAAAGGLVPARRAVRVLALAALGAAVNLWFLLPALVYHNRTQLGSSAPPIRDQQITVWPELLGLVRETPQPPVSAFLQAQLPVLALLWCLAVALAFAGGAPRRLRRATAGLAAVLAVLVARVLGNEALAELPAALRFVQFPYRLVTYATLLSALLVVAGLLLVARAAPAARLAPHAFLVLAAVVSGVLAVRQVDRTPTTPVDRAELLDGDPRRPPRTWYRPAEFADVAEPLLGASRPGLVELPAVPGEDRVRMPLPGARAGETLATDVRAGSYLVAVQGAAPVGHTEARGMVVRIAPGAGPAGELTFSTAPSRALRAGQAGSVLAALGAAGVLGTLAWRRRRPGREPA